MIQVFCGELMFTVLSQKSFGVGVGETACGRVISGGEGNSGDDMVVPVLASPINLFNSIIYLSHCAKYPVRLIISFPFAISSRNVVAFLDMKSAFIIILLFFNVFPCSRNVFP